MTIDGDFASVRREETVPAFDGLLGGELCRACGRISRVGFHVPDAIWEAACHQYRVLCVVCFGAFADERLLDWDRDIEFFPVSQLSSMQLQGWTVIPIPNGVKA